jgi:hypothetical protein
MHVRERLERGRGGELRSAPATMIGPNAPVHVHLARAIIFSAADLGRQVWQAVVHIWSDQKREKAETGFKLTDWSTIDMRSGAEKGTGLAQTRFR